MTQLPKLAFSFSLEGQVWKTSMDEHSGVLALEIRNQDQMSLHFILLDINRGSVSETIHISETDWWCSLRQFKDGYLFIEKYQDTNSPTKKDLLVFEMSSQQVVKRFDLFQLISFNEGMLTIQSVESPDEIKELQLNIPNNREEGGLLLRPTYYDGESSGFGLVKELLSDQSPELGCEYLEWKNFIIISYYIRSGKEFVRNLLLVKDENEWMDITIDKEIKGFAPGAFFLYNDLLVYIVEQNKINAIKL